MKKEKIFDFYFLFHKGKNNRLVRFLILDIECLKYAHMKLIFRNMCIGMKWKCAYSKMYFERRIGISGVIQGD
jgi:hypothetical protein